MFNLLTSLGADMKVLNLRKFSPLTLAAQQGQRDMFNFMLEHQREVNWTYGPITFAKYPLREIDSAGGYMHTRADGTMEPRYLNPTPRRGLG